ncbi:LysR family transcriptional regulator [Paracoccus limosus]|jgi:DNA-binding transcriptional LysR family regulator|uniref:LysR family transcriptional regulator n=1 Tax=Paracoccus limosus TaxID=913252 RepID=A0A844GX90_9RHOB|nr:LysR family transcriptional regulator [Paracoccus limosus]MTH33306.1 LysR family transcriptional regulator [Paracoccus limosus]
MRLNLWTEIRTVAQVARLGRVSAAAEALGMHHASVIRHIDTLEAELGAKLFQRHARGYTPTEAGQELLRTASLVDEHFVQMRARIDAARHEISGRLVLTVVPGLVDLMLPVIRRYLLAHPKVQLVFSADQRNYELSRGEAHIALRAGPRPTGLDHVVSRAFDWTHALFAAPEYIQKHGQPRHLDELAQHRFVGGEDSFARVPFNLWLDSRVPEDAFALRTPQSGAAYRAIRDGLGIGFLGRATAWPKMVELFPDFDPPEWRVAVWMVTHVDLHRSPKVQSLTRFIQDEIQTLWQTGRQNPTPTG